MVPDSVNSNKNANNNTNNNTNIRKYNIAVAESRFDSHLKQDSLTFDEIVEKFRTPIVTNETVEEYKKLPKDQKDNIKDHGGFVGGLLNNGRRQKKDVLSRSLIALDLDYATPSTFYDIKSRIDVDSFVYSTHKSTPESPRFRLVIPLSRDIKPIEYEPIARKIAEKFGMDVFDDSTYEFNRMMYFPTVSKDGVYIFEIFNHNKLLNPDDILSLYDDYLDVSLYPHSSRTEAKINHEKKTLGDPLLKKNLIGAFCNCYTVTEALNIFLPDVYRQSRRADRYDFIEADSKNGVQIFDDKFLYSHHSSDPASGQLLNAFDVVRIHKFGDLDKESSVKQINRLPSYKKMCEFALEDKKVKEYLASKNIGVVTFECPDWREKLSYEPKTMKVKATLENLQYILANDENLKDVRFNAFLEQVYAENVPWKMQKPPTWSNGDDDQLVSYLSANYALFTDRIFRIAFSKITLDRMYHPVKEYFESLAPWDKVPRLDTLFIDYLGADDNVYTREATRKMMVAVVSRIYEPGCKFDEVVVLSGSQGIGKSTLFARLGRDWFSDSLTMNDMKDKAAPEKLQGYIILEIGELAGMKKVEIETLKGFITRQDDKFRPAYGHHVENHKRQCIIVGTTNKGAFLRDITGNRRFWPIKVKGVEKKPWDITDSDVDQIWAETIFRYKNNESFKLSDEADAIAMETQRESMEEDDREGIVRDYLEMPLPNNWYQLTTEERIEKVKAYRNNKAEISEWKGKRYFVSNIEIWAECFMKDITNVKNADSYTVAGIIKKIGGFVKTDDRITIPPYGQQRIYRITDEDGNVVKQPKGYMNLREVTKDKVIKSGETKDKVTKKQSNAVNSNAVTKENNLPVKDGS